MGKATRAAIFFTCLSSVLGHDVWAKGQPDYKKMTAAGCDALLSKNFPADRTVDGTILTGVTVERFIEVCKARAERYLKVSPRGEFTGDKYTVGLVQATCQGPVSPDLYKTQADWMRNRIACFQTMFEYGTTPTVQGLAKFDAYGGGSREPSSDATTLREAMHRYERELNRVTYGVSGGQTTGDSSASQ